MTWTEPGDGNQTNREVRVVRAGTEDPVARAVPYAGRWFIPAG